VSPVSVFELMIRISRADSVYHQPAISGRLKRMAAALPRSTAAGLRDGDWTNLAADTTWVLRQPPTGRAFLQEYFHYQMLHRDRATTTATESGLRTLRARNASERQVSGWKPSGSPLGSPIAFRPFHPYTRWTLATSLWQADESRVGLRFRPCLHGMNDPWPGFRRTNTMELLSAGVSSRTNGTAPRLEDLVLFAQRSLMPSDWLFQGWSWLLDASLRRGAPLAADAMHACVQAGLGRAVGVGRDITGYALATAACLGARSTGAAFVPGAQVGGLCLLGESWRLGAQVDWYDGPARADAAPYRCDLWVHRDLGPHHGMTLRGVASDDRRVLSAEIHWYP
jgi:hypothetical protein